MTANTDSAKNRTVALPNLNKSALAGSKAIAKNADVTAMVDAMWNGMVFGPYLIPLSRRAE